MKQQQKKDRQVCPRCGQLLEIRGYVVKRPRVRDVGSDKPRPEPTVLAAPEPLEPQS